MMDFQQKKRMRKVLYSPKVALLLLVVFVFLARGAWGAYTKERESRLNLNKVEEDYSKAMEREAFLSEEIDRLSTEEGMEEEIRGKFNVTKPGEEVVLVIESEGDLSEEVAEKQGFWKKLISFFKKD